MLKEICITPQVFDNDHIDVSNWKDIKTLLEAIESSGYIVGLNNQDWTKAIRQNLNTIDSQKIKDKFHSIIDLLKDRKRIVGHPKSDIIPENEDDWLRIAIQLNEIREFHTILATQSNKKEILGVDKLEDMNIVEKFGITGSKHYLKSEEELKKIFLPLLSYAKKITIIDPYFDIANERYKVTLKTISQSFKERRGHGEKGSIIINCSSKIVVKECWKKVIQGIFQKFGHIVTINIWEKKEDSIKLHDRYIITDQVGIVSAAGTDKDDYQQSEWSIKDYNTLNEILSQYKENSSPFKLKCIVSASNIENR